MNRIYKVIWSKVKHQYVVVSELAHSNGKQNSKSERNSLSGSLRTLAAALMVGGSLLAMPYTASAAEGDVYYQLQNGDEIVNVSESDLNSYFKLAEKQEDGTYAVNGQIVANEYLYAIDFNGDGQDEIGAFVVDGNVYTGDVYNQNHDVVIPEVQHTISNEDGFYVSNGKGTYNSLTKDGLWVGGTKDGEGFHVDNDGNVRTTGNMMVDGKFSAGNGAVYMDENGAKVNGDLQANSGTVGGVRLQGDKVTAESLAAGALTADANGAKVDGDLQANSGTVGGVRLQGDKVTAESLAAGALTADANGVKIDGDLQANSGTVGGVRLQGDNVTANDVNAKNVTAETLNGGIVTGEVFQNADGSFVADANGNVEAKGNATIKGGLTAGNLQTEGMLTAGSADINGNATIDGIATVGGLKTNGNVEAHNVAVKNELTAGKADVEGLLTAGSASIEGNAEIKGGLTAGNLQTEGMLTAGSADINGNATIDGIATVGRLKTNGNVEAHNVAVKNELTAGKADVEGLLTTGSVVSETGISAADGQFVVDGATGAVSTTKAQINNVTIGADDSTAINVGNGKFVVYDDGALRAADSNFIVQKTGNVKANGTLSVAKQNDGSYAFTVDENGAVSAANGEFTVAADGTTVADGVKLQEGKVTANKADIGDVWIKDGNITHVDKLAAKRADIGGVWIKDNTVTSLKNTEWNGGENAVANRAATEGQLSEVQGDVDNLEETTEHIVHVTEPEGTDYTSVEGTKFEKTADGSSKITTDKADIGDVWIKDGNVTNVNRLEAENGTVGNVTLQDGKVTATKADIGGVYIKDDTVTSLKNTEWDGTNYVSGRAATEDQLNVVQGDVDNLEDKTTDIEHVTKADGTHYTSIEGTRFDSDGTITNKDNTFKVDAAGKITANKADIGDVWINEKGLTAKNGDVITLDKNGKEKYTLNTIGDNVAGISRENETTTIESNTKIDDKGLNVGSDTKGVTLSTDGTVNASGAMYSDGNKVVTWDNEKNNSINGVQLTTSNGLSKVKADKANIGNVIIKNDEVRSLNNTNWNVEDVVKDRAATEGQLLDVDTKVNQNADKLAAYEEAGIIAGDTNGGTPGYNSKGISLGEGSQATGFEAVAVGPDSHAWGTQSTAIGATATASAENSVALGSNSVADRANTVSIGAEGAERQITNVAAGTELTDAVNVAQLNETADGMVKWDQNTAGEYQEGTIHGVTLKDGTIAAADGKFNVYSNGSVNAADGKFSVYESGSLAIGEADTDGKRVFTVNSNSGNVITKGTMYVNGNEEVATKSSVEEATANMVEWDAGTKDTIHGVKLDNGTITAANGGFKVYNNGRVEAAGGKFNVWSSGGIGIGDKDDDGYRLFSVNGNNGDVFTKGDVTAQGTMYVNGDEEVATKSSVDTIKDTLDDYENAGIIAGTSNVDNDIVIGNGSSNTAEYGIAIGEQASNTGFGSMAVGAHTMVSGNNSVALGFDSQATENNVVSVGGYAPGTQRRIINVADGIEDSDAATVGQMNTAIDTATEGSVKWDTGTTNTINGVTLQNGDVSVTDNGAEYTLKTVGQNTAGITCTASDSRTRAEGFTTTIENTLSVDGSQNRIAVLGSDGKENFVVNDFGMMAVKNADATKNVFTVDQNGNVVATGKINAKEMTVNGEAVALEKDVASKDSVTEINTALDNYEAAGVTAGTVDESATNSIVIGSGATAVKGNHEPSNAVVMGTNATTSNWNTVAIGASANVSGENSVVIGQGSTATGYNSVALGTGSSVTGNNSVALGYSSQATDDNVVSVGTTDWQRRIINVADGVDVHDAVTVGQMNAIFGFNMGNSSGENLSSKLTNGASSIIGAINRNSNAIQDIATHNGTVSPGKNSWDDYSEDADDTFKDDNPPTILNSARANDIDLSAYAKIAPMSLEVEPVEAAANGIATMAETGEYDTTREPSGSDASASHTGDDVHTGNGDIINGDAHVTGNAQIDGTLNVGGNATFDGTATFNEEATFNKGASMKGDLNMNNNKITGLAEGSIAEGSTDAVTGGQIFNMQNDMNSRMDGIENRMNDVEDRIDKVGAMAAAIANLRTMGYDPEAPTEIAVGIGQYRSETGLALGIFHYPNQDFMLSASISTSGDEVMGGIGATWKLGRKSKSPEQQAKDNEAKMAAKAEEIQQAAKRAEVKAQADRHAQLLAEREAAGEPIRPVEEA